MLKFKSIFFSLLLALCLIGFTACSDDDSNPATVTNSNTLSGSVSGMISTNFSASNTTYVFQTVSSMTASTIAGTSINGTTQDVCTLQLMNLQSGASTITLGTDYQNGYGQIMFARVNNGVAQQYVMIAGTINITVNTNSEIRGTFSCKTDAIPGNEGYLEINNGAFYCKKN